jgi:hypothetical protein
MVQGLTPRRKDSVTSCFKIGMDWDGLGWKMLGENREDWSELQKDY